VSSTASSSPAADNSNPTRRRRRARADSASPAATSRLLSAQDAAAYLGVPYTSLRDWALRGHIPLVRVPGARRLWFDRKDLDQAIDRWKERAL
jgi:excisionase family DNA binding protein